MFRKSELIILVFIINGLFGQESARGLGLGGSMVTLSRGVSAVGINPANLAYSSPSINLINYNFLFYNNLLSLKVYNDLNGADLENPNSPLTKIDFLNLLNGENFGFYNELNSNIPGVSFSNSKYAFTAKLKQELDLNIGNSLFKTVFFGNEWETDIPLTIDATSQTVMEYGLSSWFKFDGISIGYTLKYLQGVSLFKLYTGDESNPLYTDSTGIDMSIVLGREFYPGGSGFGIDFGFLTKETDNGWSLGLSITNLFGYINWDKHNLNYALIGKPISNQLGLNAYKTEYFSFEIKDLNASDLMAGSIEISDSIISDTSYTQELNSPVYKTDYPSIFRFGLSKNFDDNFYLAYESRTGFQKSKVMPVNWIHSIGLEIIRWKIFPFRVGLTSGDLFNHKFSFGGGIHLNPIQIDFGLSWMGSRKIYTANGLDFGLTVTLLR
jgi:hypothetical protein